MTKFTAIKVERRKTSKGSAMFTFSNESGDTVNVFDSQFYGMQNAGYKSILDLELGDVQWWRTHPVIINTVQKGKYLNASSFVKAHQDAKPDAPLTFPRNTRFESAKIQLQHLFELDNVVVWDSETTGVLDFDEILSIGAVRLSDGASVFPEENIYIRPVDMSRVELASDIHGITADVVADKPTFPEVYERIRDALHKEVWVAYNGNFDWLRLDIECARHNLSPIVPLYHVDAMELWGKSQLDWTKEVGDWPRIKLTDAIESAGFDVVDAHNAYGDSVMTRKLLKHMFESL